MRIVGIDPSYARTGVATSGDTRSLDPPPGPPPRRRAWLRGQLAPIVSTADVVAIEGLYPATQQGWLDRAYLVGAIIDQAWQYDAAILVVAPASAKILATGDGGPKTDKPAMLAAAERAGSPARNGDEADAYWVAELARLVTDPMSAGLYRGMAPQRARALDPYLPPYKTDPWIRHPGDTR